MSTKNSLILRVNHINYKKETEFFITDKKRNFYNEELNIEEGENFTILKKIIRNIFIFNRDKD